MAEKTFRVIFWDDDPEKLPHMGHVASELVGLAVALGCQFTVVELEGEEPGPELQLRKTS